MTEVVSPKFVDTDSDSDSVDQIYNIGAMAIQMIGSVKVALMPSRNVSESNATVQDMPQDKMFQFKECH